MNLDLSKPSFIVLKNNEPVGVDKASGGEPYIASSLNSIRYWINKTEAMKYARVCNSNKDPIEFTVASVQLMITKC